MFFKTPEVVQVERTKIMGTGSYVPDKIISNADLEKIVDTTDQWIVERTGIKERRQAAPDEVTSDMATKAAIATKKIITCSAMIVCPLLSMLRTFS